jgi:hypothetical protein
MKIIAITAVMAAFLATPATALALSFVQETFGNAPVVKQPEWAEGVLGVVNLKSRVYLTRSIGGLANAVDENFFYKGDARALSEALRKFAAVKADERRLVLLPCQGKRYSFDKKRIDFDWQLQVRSGLCKEVTGSKHAVLTVYVSVAKPDGRPDPNRVERLIGDLDNDSFQKRQKAERELQALEGDAKPFLRDALKVRKELELTRRIERLLKRLPGFDVGDLEIPPGVTALTPSDLFAEHFESLSETDLTRCNIAGYGLVELAPYSAKVVPALTALLNKSKSEYIRRVAASCLERIGAGAKTALPALKMGLGDPDPNVRTAFRSAVDQIEKARDEPGWGKEVKKRRAILKDLDEWKKARGE